MLNNEYICALDIGSSKIASCVARIRSGRISDIFFDSLPAKDSQGGVIIDSIELVNHVTRLMKNLKAKSNINIKSVYVGISGQDIVTKHARAVMPLAERGNKVITLIDLDKINEQARILGSSLEEEVLHQIPCGYSIDSKSDILNPIGLYSHRLEVDLYLVCAKLSTVQSLSRVINQSGFDAKGIFFSGLASASAVFGEELKTGLHILCDVGSDITELLIFREGVLSDIEILPIGGNDLTAQLEETLQMPFDLAEEIKISYGVITDPALIDDDKEILVKKSSIYKTIKQKFIAEIINPKAKSVCLAIKGVLEKKMRRHEVDSVTVCGRCGLLDGFIETLENTLQMPVSLGRITNPQILSLIKEERVFSGQKYLDYLVALGIILQAQKEKPQGALFFRQPAKNLILKAVNRFKDAYQEYF
ncbi:MAG: cell division protein FtsA [Candidatus Omnitrophica bacterium]|nr:cell division protein FtsA [Candidatus Omnitrophota bacterium]